MWPYSYVDRGACIQVKSGSTGTVIARIRGGLELLAVAYNFDGVESDFQLKFTKRGSASIRVISQDELAYVSDPGSPVPELFGETRAQDVDLPARFTVRYNDIDRQADRVCLRASRHGSACVLRSGAGENGA
jgi:hypothetical protein